MGIALMLFWFGYFFIALIIFLILAKVLTVLKFKYTGLILTLLVLITILYPFRRAIFFKTVFYFYERSPLQEIHETVENPVSVYWEDNVWPGWDERTRRGMVEAFLDGVHLKILALNGDDGKIYLYRANEDSFKKSKEIWPDSYKKTQILLDSRKKAAEIIKNGGNTQDHLNATRAKLHHFGKTQPKGYYEQRQIEINQIMDQVEIYQSRADLPGIHYRVELNFLPATRLVNTDRKIIHADRISIIG